jgi:cytochrome c oxidase subunit II
MKNFLKFIPKASFLLPLAGPVSVCAAASGWQMGLQDSASPVMQEVRDFHQLLMWIICGIGLLVIGLVLYASWNFQESRNPNPSSVASNVTLEVTWTLIPVLILAVIAIPSFQLLYYMDRVPVADMTIKVTGHQWYWTYEYPDHGNINFDSYMIEDKDLKPGHIRLLSVDKPLVVPANKNIRIITTSEDVIHSWAVPAFGVKKDAVPGRINETWFHANQEGMYYGQCSELCGIKHGFMPIAVQVVSPRRFQDWLEQKGKIAI